jgi:hypothetical protein
VASDHIFAGAVVVWGERVYVRLWNNSKHETVGEVAVKGKAALKAVNLTWEGSREHLPDERVFLRPWRAQTIEVLDLL